MASANEKMRWMTTRKEEEEEEEEEGEGNERETKKVQPDSSM